MDAEGPLPFLGLFYLRVIASAVQPTTCGASLKKGPDAPRNRPALASSSNPAPRAPKKTVTRRTWGRAGSYGAQDTEQRRQPNPDDAMPKTRQPTRPSRQKTPKTKKKRRIASRSGHRLASDTMRRGRPRFCPRAAATNAHHDYRAELPLRHFSGPGCGCRRTCLPVAATQPARE